MQRKLAASQLKLAARAAELSRRVYVTLPRGYRIAQMLIRLAGAAQDSWGRFFYAEFIKAGVEDMPDIKGEPASLWREKLLDAGTKAADKLPPGYGRDFGMAIYRQLLKHFKNPGTVQDIVHSYITDMAGSRRSKIKSGFDRKQAEKFILRALFWKAKDVVKKTKVEEITQQFPTDDEGAMLIDPEDPHTYRHLDDALPSWQKKRLFGELLNIYPKDRDRPIKYIEGLMEGRSKVEMAEDMGLTPQNLYQWEKVYRPEIERVIHKHLRAAA